MTMYGADVEALDSLASRFQAHKETMIGLIHEVTGEIDAVMWEGPDAESLRPDWTDRLGRLLGAIDDGFSTIALEVNQQAAEQRQASET